MKISAVIMAAGRSTRMGENKLLKPLKEKEIIRHFLDNFPKILFDKTIAVYADDRVGAILSEYGLITVKNDTGGTKDSTIKLGTKECLDADGIMFFTADQPFTGNFVINKMTSFFRMKYDHIIIPMCAGKRRNPVLFPAVVFDELMNLSGDTGGRDVIHSHPELCAHLDFSGEEQFLDIDTPEDFKRAESML